MMIRYGRILSGLPLCKDITTETFGSKKNYFKVILVIAIMFFSFGYMMMMLQ